MKEFKTNFPLDLKTAVETIKKAILQGQYEAAKEVNRVQLAVYFGIGKYVSMHTRKGVWGTGALESISEQLRKELPGLKGYSATNLKKMRLFYEQWIMLDPKSSVATDELQIRKYDIDIYHTIQITNIKDFPVEDFFKVPFTHHVEIFGLDDFKARYYYIHRVAEEHMSVELLKKLIKDNAYSHREQMLNNFDLTIPNAATMRKAVMMFKDSYFLDFINTEHIRKALPDVEELKKLL